MTRTDVGTTLVVFRLLRRQELGVFRAARKRYVIFKSAADDGQLKMDAAGTEACSKFSLFLSSCFDRLFGCRCFVAVNVLEAGADKQCNYYYLHDLFVGGNRHPHRNNRQKPSL